MVVAIEKKLDQAIFAIHEMKNQFNTRIDKKETRFEENYQKITENNQR